METRIEKLIDTFQKNGWELRGSIDISSEWWFNDIFQLSSIWRPTNKTIYLTLLTDPQISNKKEIWAIGVSESIPDNRLFKFIKTIALNEIMKIDLQTFVKSINNTVL